VKRLGVVDVAVDLKSPASVYHAQFAELDASNRPVRQLHPIAFTLSHNPGISAAMTKRILIAALETGDLPAAVAPLDQDVVFHSPILATIGDEVRGHAIVAKILQTAFACYGMPRNVEEFQNPDGRYIVTFDGSIDGNLIQIAILVTENAARKVDSIRLFARPWPVVKLFREFMERNLRPDPVPDALTMDVRLPSQLPSAAGLGTEQAHDERSRLPALGRFDQRAVA
jgi:hypothetical protein